MPDNTQDDWDSSEESVEDTTTNVEEDQSCSGCHFSPKTTFIKNHFHQKPLSSKKKFVVVV